MGETILVTGAGGFLGTAITRHLREAGHDVITLSRQRYGHLDGMVADQLQTNLGRDDDAWWSAAAEVTTVFHVAAKVGMWGRAIDFLLTNLGGTESIVRFCKRPGSKVRRLIYTSTPSVVFGTGDHPEPCPWGQDMPYPKKHLAHYPASKALAERYALMQHSGDLHVTALRPHLVWGPGDENLIPRLVDRAKAGRLRIVGDGKNLVHMTYIDNAVHAHLCAHRVLAEQGEDCPAGGKAYFIGSGEPVVPWEWLNRLLVALGHEPVTRQISLKTAVRVGGVMEFLWRILPLPGEPPMTRFVARNLGMEHFFDLEPAARDLGYTPVVDEATGFERLVAALSAASKHP